MSDDITPGMHVWTDNGGPVIESFRVESVDGDTVHLTDTVDINETLVTQNLTRERSDVWVDRAEAIRDGVAHPDDWAVTSHKKKYWDAYYDRE